MGYFSYYYYYYHHHHYYYYYYYYSPIPYPLIEVGYMVVEVEVQ